MTYKVTIGVVIMAIMLLFSGTVSGVEIGSSAIDEQIAKAYVEIKCDPCDYNLDYGGANHPVETGGVDEGTVKLKCDPCDYNIDHGNTDDPIEK